MGCYVRGDKNNTGCFVGVTKTAWDVLSGVANLCGQFCPGCQKWHGMFCLGMFCPALALIRLCVFPGFAGRTYQIVGNLMPWLI